MKRYIVRRLGHGFLLMVIVMMTTFVIFQVIGDPVRRILPANATDEQVSTYGEANGFHDPLPTRLWRYISSIIRLDFGTSYTTGTDPLPIVLEAFPRTLVLAAVALPLAVFLGIGLGMLAASYRDTIVDRLVVGSSIAMVSLAEFWVGMQLIVLFSVTFRLLPTSGYGVGWTLVLPAITLAIFPMGRFAFFVRNNVVEVLDQPHVEYARSMGLERRSVLGRHVLRNASIPVLALGGIEAARMLVGGAVVVETVFAWPGIGRLYVTGMERYDLPLVTATLFVATVVIVILNIGLDLLYARLDPRVTYS